MDTPSTDVFSPFAIGALRLPNRLVRSATTSGWADARGVVGPEIVARYEELARGDIGLIIKGHLYVDRRGKAHAGMAGAGSDEHVPGLARLAEGVHAHGGRILAQINHGGYEAEVGERMGPSDFATGDWRARAMDAGEIRAVIRAFGEAGRRCLVAGFDGVQLHAAHGYLLSQFLSNIANRRTDEWGGSVTNRMRLVREIYLELRARLGDDAVVGVKLNCDDFSPDGFTVDEAAEVAGELSQLGVDLIEVSGGGQAEDARLRERARAAEPALAEASFAGHCARIRAATGATPLALVDGHTTLAGMRAVLESGIADLVSLSRPFIREPGLARNLAAGQAQVTCTRCDGCYDFIGVEMMHCALD